MTTPQLVTVTWDDAQASATKLYQAEMHKPIAMVTVGWLLKEDKLGVSVACERYQDEGQWIYRGHTFVPRGIITAIKKLK